MWNKPSELTEYTGSGYEIGTWVSGTTVTAQGALVSWQGSTPHHDVIVNEGIWADYDWAAMGGAMTAHYAAVWFGTEPDLVGD